MGRYEWKLVSVRPDIQPVRVILLFDQLGILRVFFFVVRFYEVLVSEG
jgi:hypothetical protein